MDNKEKCCGKNVIKGITCDVKDCCYNEGGQFCTADHIEVGPCDAQMGNETLCATFRSKEEG